MKAKDTPDRGQAGFSAYYSGIWGERWEPLSAALEREGGPEPWERGLSKPYLLDAASVFAALALGSPRGEACLDLCAAPGGKSLVVAGGMEESTLLCNELSADRFFRLKRVIEEHLEPGRRAALGLTRGDGASLCRKLPSSFDRILLDAPCSSERHVMAAPAYMAEWSRSRVRDLPFRQWALLSAAFLMLREGGRLVYATCSVNPGENEAVFSRLFSKYRDQAEELDPLSLVEAELGGLDEGWKGRIGGLLSRAERRGRGVAILPDTAGGVGPIYVAAASKRARTLLASSIGP